MRSEHIETPDVIGESEATEQVTVSVPPIPSPAATGGAGYTFEQHVDAYWLGLLLVRAIPPILIDCTLEEVYLQTRHLGWQTDDFLVVGRNGSGQLRKLSGQIKLNFTVSAKNDECKKTIQGFWTDFKNSDNFSQDSDRFALVTLRGTNSLLEHFSGLLDCARASHDVANFEHRLSTTGFINQKSVRHLVEIRKIIDDSEGRDVSTAEIWQFLRKFHVLSMDLTSTTSQMEATMKSLLAYVTTESDPIGVADATWNRLLRVASEGMSTARRYRREDLPEELTCRHRPIANTEHSVLQSLRDHSALILDGIQSKIGDLHLGRYGLVQQVIEQLESAQVILISGPAGSGKSAIAKDVLRLISNDYFTFSFRAEEFARAHLDETLQAVQISSNAATLGAIVAGQDRKVLLVESIERLLEESTRNAFADLLTLVKKDTSWHLVLTCRDYSISHVQAAFLGHESVVQSVVTVPPFADEELGKIKATYPVLTRPLANAELCRVLRNPYVLDKALQIDWSENQTLPQSEREFRELFWHEIVRVDHYSAGGMPSKREKVFVEVALRRARSLSMYVDCEDLGSEVVEALRRDSLIVASPEADFFLTPVHDVMEDWAILHWIQKQYLKHEGSLRELSAAIGTFPAVRRTYRKWAAELVESSPEASDRMFQDIVTESGIASHFRDDTLVSLLGSLSSATFLERHAAELFAHNNRLLRQVIHLLQVACVTVPSWMGTLPAPTSFLNVPDGPAWGSVLRLVQNHLSSFSQKDNLLLLGLIKDWSRGVNPQNPYPDGSEAVAGIAHGLLPNFSGHRLDDQRTTILQIIAKIPKADSERFTNLFLENPESEWRDSITDQFQRIIFAELDGMPTARDMPEIFVSVAKEFLLCSEAELQSELSYQYSLELETLFGIKHARSYDFSPTSAYQGPFLLFLRHHPREGLDFIVEIFNHSADWYARPRMEYRNVERPFEITLTFADGTSQTQWCNPRLWNLYRGTSVGPNVLQSMLMALEHWLLEIGETDSHELDEMLLGLLKKSESGALTAVVASIATAFSHDAGETLLVLLQSPDCIQLDLQRRVNEMRVSSSSVFSELNERNQVYVNERKKTAKRPHRQCDLESAILHLQLGHLASRVHQILDQYRAELPPLVNQNEDNSAWRLALNRMDSRQYTVSEHVVENSISSETPASPEDNRSYIRLDPIEPEPDLRDITNQSNTQLQTTNAKAELLMWGINTFERKEEAVQDASQWRQRLREARNTVEDNDAEEDEFFREAPGFIASVCVRDHWEEMSEDEQVWCVNIICSTVSRDGDCWDETARIQQNRMSADRTCAWILPLLFKMSLSEIQKNLVRQSLAKALTHPINEVRWYVASGIGKHLWTIDRELALHCVNALATEAILMQIHVDANSRGLYLETRQMNDIMVEVASIVRTRFNESHGIPNDALQQFDSTQGYGAEANKHILAILCLAPCEPTAIAAFKQLAHTLVGWWDDAGERRETHDLGTNRTLYTESALLKLLQNFLLRTQSAEATTILKPILDAVDRHSENIHQLVQGLVFVEDSQPNTPQFWSIWKLFADRVRRTQWLSQIDDERANGAEMVSAIFLGQCWKKEVRHWSSLDGHAENLHSLFEDLPLSSRVLEEYLRFLFQIGEQSLPDAFIRIASKLNQESSPQIVKSENLIFYLEVLLQSYVYRRPLELKRRQDLRQAVLSLLNLLVETGSSAAFRMRDDFVTPIPRN